MTQSSSPFEDLSFEEALKDLETIVKQFEEGRLTLDDAISSYEKASLLQKHCLLKLDQAQAKIKKVMPSGSPSDAGPESE